MHSKFLALTTIALSSFLFLTKAQASTEDCQISAPKGKIVGAKTKDTKACVYKGIPFATPPEGKLRFFPPKAHTGFKTPFVADKFGDECPNYPISFPPTQKWIGSENCLFLNIWHKPDKGTKKPVMVWIHGGGFVTGSGSTGIYDGTRMVDMGDVIVVTINYRLGLLGFLVHPEITKATKNAGNLGLQDQVMSLEWVKENIASFGGDPNNVTVFGESAGGMSIVSLLVAPSAKGLFHKAIIQSGPMIILNGTVEGGNEEGVASAEKLGCKDSKTAFDCLQKASLKDIMTKVKSVLGLGASPSEVDKFAASPVVDGKFIPAHPYKMLKEKKSHPGVAIMTGTTADEMSLFLMGRSLNTWEDYDKLVKTQGPMIQRFLKLEMDMDSYIKLFPRTGSPYKTMVDMTSDMAFHCPTWIQAELLDDGKNKPFVYLHSKPLTTMGIFGKMGAFHGSDLPFTFGIFKLFNFNLENPKSRLLSDKYIKYWTSFARTGTPGGEGLPQWPGLDKTDQKMLNLHDDISLIPIPKKPSCDFVRTVMDSNYLK